MRLVCPNCGAQYEVSAEVIPETGRDVQCSNCGKTWFQRPEADDAEVDDAAHSETSEPTAQSTSDEVEDDDEEVLWPDGEPDNDDVEETPASGPKPSELDPEIADVLKAEAEYEARAREAEAAGIETQPDLGLEEGSQDTQARDRMARMRGLEPEAAAAIAAGSRREILPDIEEINSTLSADNAEQEKSDEEQEPIRRRGFRGGFFSVLILAGLLILIYMMAPQITGAVPAMAGVMDSYVSLIDALRLWVDGLLQQVTAGLM